MAEAQKPTLTYFTLHGKADCIRMLLKKAGVDFNDVCLTFEEFGEQAAAGRFPAGQVPIWQTADGKELNQCYAILRLLGRQHGFYDSGNAEESFKVDWALETTLDYQITKAYRVQMNETSTEEEVDAAKAAFAKYNGQIAGALTKNNTTFFAGDRLTIADFVILSTYLCSAWNESCDKPIVQAHAETAAATPIIGQYCDRVKAELGDIIAQRAPFPV